MTLDDRIHSLERFVRAHRSIAVLTGAGCSTESGIPDYRDAEGNAKHKEPVRFAEFRASERVRRRYWSRSAIGWKRIEAALPNSAHYALAALQDAGIVSLIVTQNVDGLHQRAGSTRVVDLHGRLERVECLTCRGTCSRDWVQRELEKLNGVATAAGAAAAPDGDAELPNGDSPFDAFCVPECAGCGGVLKPAVVFFGENVPPGRVEAAASAVERAEALLVVGTSLTVFSGYRFVRLAHRLGRPIAMINLGKTRADSLVDLKLVERAGPLLEALCFRLGLVSGPGARGRGLAQGLALPDTREVSRD